MTIEYNLRTSVGGSYLINLPDPSRIPVPAVREAVEKLAKHVAKHRDAAAALATSRNAIDRAKEANGAEAAEAALDGGGVPTKKLVKRLRAAEDAHEEAKLEYAARESALIKAYGSLVATIQHHAPAWRAAADTAADAAVLRVTTAREMLRKAGADLEESLGTLGMLDRLTTGYRVAGRGEPVVDNVPVLSPIDKSSMYVSIAFENMASAIGEAMDSLDVQRGAVSSKPDVVVPVPEHETVDEFAIVAETDSDDE